MPIERAQMELRITAPAQQARDLKAKLKPLLSTVQRENDKGYECTCLIDPGNFRSVEELIKGTPQASVEVLRCVLCCPLSNDFAAWRCIKPNQSRRPRRRKQRATRRRAMAKLVAPASRRRPNLSKRY